MIAWFNSIFTRWLTNRREYEGIPLCDFERIRYELRTADVLLIEGRSRVSDIIKGITQSSWSHAALYIGRLHEIEDPKIRNLLSLHFNGAPDTQLVIEGVMGKGTIVSPITNYEKDHIRLCRPKGLSRRDAQLVINYAVKRLGTHYDVIQILDLARFLLPWSFLPKTFRSTLFEYRPGESTKTVCSTMIAEAFDSVQFPILPLVKSHATTGIELITRNPKLFTPRDFDYSPYFEIIKYPFVEFADYAMYRKLPWNQEGLLSHDRVGIEKEGIIKPYDTPEPDKNINEDKKAFSGLKKLKERFHKKSIEPSSLPSSEHAEQPKHSEHSESYQESEALKIPENTDETQEKPIKKKEPKQESVAELKETKETKRPKDNEKTEAPPKNPP